MSTEDERLSPELDRLYDLPEQVQEAAEEAGDAELARALSHLRTLHVLGRTPYAVAALGRLVGRTREALRRIDPEGGAP